MGLFDSFGDLFTRPTPACEKCKEAGRGEVTMESDIVRDPSQGFNVDAWVCPECGHSVYRGDDPETHDPTHGSGPKRDDESGGQSDLSTGVVPMDGFADDDDEWTSIR